MPIRSSLFLLLAVTLMLNAGGSASVQLITDDFNDNSRDGTKWTDTDDPANGVVRINEVNQRLEFTTVGSVTAAFETVRATRILPGDDRSWEVVVDVANLAVIPQTTILRVASLGISIANNGNLNQSIYHELYVAGTSPASAAEGFVSEMLSFGVSQGIVDTSDQNVTSATIRMNYDHTTQIIRTFVLDQSQAWIQIASFGVGPNGGGTTGNENWAANGTHKFTVSLYGFTGGLSLASGDMYADNLRVTLGATSAPTLPAITTQLPATLAVNAGSSIPLTIGASGDGLSYHWFHNGATIPQQSADSLSIMAANRASGGSYHVVVSNLAGTVTSDATAVRVRVPQSILPPLISGDSTLRLVLGDHDGGLLSLSDLSNFEVHHTTDFVNWTTNTAGMSLVSGAIHFQQTVPANSPRRFYRVREK